ncbi:MAG TPA: pepsin/retropepsin-like aspartic protease family protein [Vicinamibacterales bacterium]|nr:pepsin/retropepsin-like aspartic protease family protein [Vicinamibacterales bacterium]
MVSALLAGVLLSALGTPSGFTIPFTWTPGQIEIAVDVNGTPATFLLDTGSEYSIVSTRLATVLHLPTLHIGARDFTDEATLKVGGITLAGQRVMVMPFDGYQARGRHIDGLIGYHFFAAYSVRIDFAAKTLTAWKPSAFEAPAAAIEVPITFAGYLPVVAATVRLPGDRTLAARLMIDTGASQAIFLRYPFASEHRLIDANGRRSSAPSLADGTRTLIDVPVEQVAVGSLTFDRPNVRAFAEPVGSAASTATDGLIGNTLLSRFTLYVDYSRKRLLFEPARR